MIPRLPPSPRLPAPAGVRSQAALRDWLTDSGSLTRRIRARCAHFQVRRLAERHGAPLADEIRLMGGRPRRVRIREVLLEADGRPVVYARSILPAAALKGAFRRLAALGDRPLGEELFRPGSRRGRAVFRRLAPAAPLARSLSVADRARRPWARTSEFLRAGARVLVTEVFLDAIRALDDA